MIYAFFALYAIGHIISWLLMAGWSNAHMQSILRNKSDKPFAATWSFAAALMWPAMLPIHFFYLTHRARNGWHWK